MGILSQLEIEKDLFSKIVNAERSRKRLLVVTYKNDTQHRLENDEFYQVLENLQEKKYIKFDGLGAKTAIVFGTNKEEWRKIIDNHPSEKNTDNTIIHQEFNIENAQNIQAAGRDINNTLTESDMDNIVRIIKEITGQHHNNTSSIEKVKNILNCGSSALDILKKIAALIL